ncbi:MAG: glycosyltransferase family 2 protein [Prevotella micans]|nr:glycosyltransferase family 2 protein [Prevotella micans]
MNTQTLISIIMPMHNSAAFVGEAIESVLAQSYREWELIIVDDESTDASVSIVEAYAQKDSRIRLFRNPKPIKMPSAPRNMGLSMVKGRYIAFLDSDDMWLPEKLTQQIPLMQNPQVAIVYSNYEKMTESGKKTGRVIKAPRQADYKKLLRGNVIGNLTGIYDKEKVGIVPFLNIHHEDYAMWLSILKRGFIAQNTGTVAARYRLSSSSVSTNKYRVLSWQWNIYRNIEHISIMKSTIYFVSYAFKAFLKTL